MTTYVLVHGSFCGAWVWHNLVPLLEARGDRAIALDLPGHGKDTASLAAQTLDAYVASVCGAIDAQPEPVVLVGHSMGGIVITQTAERRPEKIRTLVYVCAFLPRDGESLLDHARTDEGSRLVANLVIDRDAGLHWPLEEGYRDAFFHDCTDQDLAFFKHHTVREPLAPVGTPLRLSEARFGRVARAYVECTEDRALTPALQRRMREATPCAKVVTMKSGHFPMFSAPAELADHLRI